MHKDLTKHEDSNCSYPVPKVPNNNGGSQNEEVLERDNRMPLDPPYVHNNFALGEIDRLIGQRGSGAINSRGKGPRNVNQRSTGVKKNNQNPRKEGNNYVISSSFFLRCSANIYSFSLVSLIIFVC